MEIESAIWFSCFDGNCIGIVLGKDSVTGKPKAYIGCTRGLDEEGDTNIIVRRGAKLDVLTAKRLHEHFTGG